MEYGESIEFDICVWIQSNKGKKLIGYQNQ